MKWWLRWRYRRRLREAQAIFFAVFSTDDLPNVSIDQSGTVKVLPTGGKKKPKKGGKKR